MINQNISRSRKTENHNQIYKKMNQSIIIIIMILILTPIAYADISLGSTISKSELTLHPGEQEMIDVSFFNTGESDIELYIEQIEPIESSSEGKDLQIYIIQKKESQYIIDPTLKLPGNLATMTPPKDTSTTWIVIGDKGDRYVPAKKIIFFIKAQDKKTYSKNRYDLIFRVKTKRSIPSQDSQTASVGQIREFRIRVEIKGITHNPSSTNTQATQTDIHTPTSQSNNNNPLSQDNLLNPNYNNDNYINKNYEDIGTDHTIDPDSNLKNAGNTSTTKDTNEESNTTQQITEKENHMTGLVTGNTTPASKTYNILTIVILLTGIFTLYYIIKPRY